jgi:signal transduction histidine kinase
VHIIATLFLPMLYQIAEFLLLRIPLISPLNYQIDDLDLIMADRELLVEKQEKARRAAAEAKKDEFFNTVSHEFKTPLTNIKAINQLLEKTADRDDKIYPFILNANHSIKRLERLIEDLLDVTCINSGQIDLNIAAFYFSDALTNSIANILLISNKHELLLEDSVTTIYAGDQFRIEQILVNLLNNAIKYSPDADKVLVKANIVSDHIFVEVQDFGIGIAKKISASYSSVCTG